MSTLQSILDKLYQYGGPIWIVLGTMGSIMSLIVYIRKNLRENPCLIDCIARNIWNFFFIYLSHLYVPLVPGYNIFPSSSNLINFM